MLRRALSLALVSAVWLTSTAPVAMAGQTSFTDTSVTGTWTVPAGVEVVQVDLQGAKGGDGLSSGTSSAGSGNWGARITSSITVTPGEVLEIGLGTPGESATGSAGGNDGGVTGLGLGRGGAGGAYGPYGHDGGGGGGASAVRIGSSVILVSGGGGGGGSANDDGLVTGAAGGSGGSGSSGYVVLNGSTWVDGSYGSAGSNSSGAQGGGGGKGSAGGSAGDGGSLGSSPGSLYNGGNGGSNLCGGGGGGAGYYGGGGGGGAAAFAESGCGGGGAGSSFMDGTRTSGNFIVSDSPISAAGSARINYIDFTTTTLATATVGENYSQSIATTFDGVSSPNAWSVSPPLPTGLSLNTSTGAITGTPTATSSATYTVTAEVTTFGTVARSSRDFALTVSARVPTISSVSPGSGPVAGGTSVQIDGSNLASVTSVTFGGVAATITSAAASRVTVLAPAGYGTVDVVVSDGTTSATAASAYAYNAPTISGVSPSSGPVTGGTSIYVDGTNLLYVNSVTVGGNAATITNTTDSRVTAIVPASGTAGSRNVVVTDSGARSATAISAFTYSAVVPGAPTSVTAVASDASADVSFTAPVSDGGSVITGYTVTANPGGSTGAGASSPITVSGLTNGVSYTFTVTATNAAGTGSASSASAAITPKATQTITFNDPGVQTFGTTPTLTATSDSGLTVTFSSSTTSICTVTGGGSLTFLSAGSCTIAAAQSGDGSYLPAVDVSRNFMVTPVVPGAPTSVAATAGDGQAEISFVAPASNGGSAITGYTVTASPGGATGSAASSPVTVTGLSNGTAYTFTVTATNAAGTGSASASSNAVTPKSPQTITFGNPGSQTFGTAPTLTATSDSGLTVTFSASTTSVCTVTGGGSLTFLSAGTCTITAAQSGDGTYLPAVDVSRSFTVTAVVPGAPTSVTAVAGDASAAVSFTAPVSDGGSSITGYTVTANPGGATSTGASSPITVAGLSNGTAYTFTVTATNAAGTSTASASSNAVAPAASGGGGGGGGNGGGGSGASPATESTPASSVPSTSSSPAPVASVLPEAQSTAATTAPTIPGLTLPTRIKPRGRTVLIPHRLYTDQGGLVKAKARALPMVRSGSAGVRPMKPAARIVTKKSGRIIVVAQGSRPFVVRLVLRAPGVGETPAYSTRHVWRVPAAQRR